MPSPGSVVDRQPFGDGLRRSEEQVQALDAEREALEQEAEVWGPPSPPPFLPPMRPAEGPPVSLCG